MTVIEMIGERYQLDCAAQERVHREQSKETIYSLLAPHLYEHLELCALPYHLQPHTLRLSAPTRVLDPVPFCLFKDITLAFLAFFFSLFYIISFFLSDGSFSLLCQHVVITLNKTTNFKVS